MLPYLLTLGATLSFSGASLIFAHYSRRISVLWMNTFKAFVAFSLLTLTLPILFAINGQWSGYAPPTLDSTLLLLISGAIGLGIGDLFLLDAFVRIGVSRTLILYGFQPIALGLAGSLLFGQTFSSLRLIAVGCLIACLIIFNLEHYRENKRWVLRGFFFALLGVSLDSGGVLLTRLAFEQSPHSQPLEGHFIRCIGALVFYAFYAGFLRLRRPKHDHTPVIGLYSNFIRYDRRTQGILFFGCFAGTFLSLCLYLTAIQIGHLASISAIAITGPMFAALLETTLQKKPISRSLALAFAFFIAGFIVLLMSAQ